MPHNRHVCGVRSIVLVVLGVQGLAIGVEATALNRTKLVCTIIRGLYGI